MAEADGIHPNTEFCTRLRLRLLLYWRQCRAVGAVHFPRVGYGQLPSLYLLTINLPEVSESIFWTDPMALPPFWRTGTLTQTQPIFVDWLESPFSLASGVPSVMIDNSYNLLVHPDHPLFNQIQLKRISRLPFDARLWPS